MGLTQTMTTIETTTHVSIGHYGYSLPPGRFATMPNDRADYYVRTGQARIATKVPRDAEIAPYTEHDFRLPAPPSEPEKLTSDDICERFKWSPEQFETAVAFCGFPPASLTSHVMTNIGTGRVIQRWREDYVMQWRDRVSSLMLR